MKRILEFWQEANGQLSNMRLNTTLATLTVCYSIIYMTVHGIDTQTVCCFVLAIAMGAKALQKKSEITDGK
jgi:hypothetical protein